MNCYLAFLKMFSMLLVFLLCLCGRVASDNHHIHNASDLISFSKAVNTGANTNGATVFLGADIYFSGGLSEQFEPIESNSSFNFKGTFDGQGHTVGNLCNKLFIETRWTVWAFIRGSNQECYAGHFFLCSKFLQRR